jgi:hypothetical protein
LLETMGVEVVYWDKKVLERRAFFLRVSEACSCLHVINPWTLKTM